MPSAPQLLTRDQFRERVLARDGFACVVCGKDAVDAHHIIERRLWPDGGYYLENGASLCAEDHVQAERTYLSVEVLRARCKITQVWVPPHLCPDQPIDKWGNPILEGGLRMRGELFYDESVRRVLEPVLRLFTPWVKFPRTYHLPWSQGVRDSDRKLTCEDLSAFVGRQVIVTEKMDGENTTMYRDHIHARSLDSRRHASRDWVKRFHGEIAHEIPNGWRICGENLYAKHAIAYRDLESYFLVFSIWNEQNVALSWKDTKEWAELLGLATVPEFPRASGLWDEMKLRDLAKVLDRNVHEGYVVRVADSISFKDYRRFVGKYVRAGHVQEEVQNWFMQPIKKNALRRPLAE